MKRVKVGVIGAGGIFRGAHLLAYPNIREAELVSLCGWRSKAIFPSYSCEYLLDRGGST